MVKTRIVLGVMLNKKLLPSLTIYGFLLVAVILAAYTVVGLYVPTGKFSSLFLDSEPLSQDTITRLASEVIPNSNGEENVRSYDYNGQEISLKYYSTHEGFNLISYKIDDEIKESDLTSDQISLYKKIAESVYRPCCSQNAANPDCSHGFAARGLIKLLAKEGWTEEEIYNEILFWHTYWWPKHYVGVAAYFDSNGQDWKEVPASTILSEDYSSVFAGRRIGAELGVSLY